MYTPITIFGATNYTAHKLNNGKILYVGGNFTTGNGASASCYLVNQSLVVGVNDLIVAEDAHLFPNPSSGAFNITVPHSREWTLRVVDATGRLNFERRIFGTTLISSTEANMPPLAPGYYSIQLISDSVVMSTKLVVH